jgi:hypothetical protein
VFASSSKILIFTLGLAVKLIFLIEYSRTVVQLDWIDKLVSNYFEMRLILKFWDLKERKGQFPEWIFVNDKNCQIFKSNIKKPFFLKCNGKPNSIFKKIRQFLPWFKNMNIPPFKMAWNWYCRKWTKSYYRIANIGKPYYSITNIGKS